MSVIEEIPLGLKSFGEPPYVSAASNFDKLAEVDPEVYELTVQETKRQSDIIRLIPSENYTTAAVMQAMATVFCNKYSEGYPGKRYYEGNELVDEIENLARDRAKKLFGADHANVQPYSGSPANLATYFALMKPGEKAANFSANPVSLRL